MLALLLTLTATSSPGPQPVIRCRSAGMHGCDNRPAETSCRPGYVLEVDYGIAGVPGRRPESEEEERQRAKYDADHSYCRPQYENFRYWTTDRIPTPLLIESERSSAKTNPGAVYWLPIWREVRKHRHD